MSIFGTRPCRCAQLLVLTGAVVTGCAHAPSSPTPQASADSAASAMASATTTAASAMASGLVVTHERNTYALAASSLRGLSAEIAALQRRGLAPKWTAETAWHVTLAPSEHGIVTVCSPEPVQFTLALTTTMPQAARLGDFTSSDQAEWTRLTGLLERQERRRDTVVVAAATKYVDEVTMRPERTPPPEPSSLSACTEGVLSRMARASAQLDSLGPFRRLRLP
jgi:hypothetical protein